MIWKYWCRWPHLVKSLTSYSIKDENKQGQNQMEIRLLKILICNVTILFATHDNRYSKLRVKCFRHLRNLGVNPVCIALSWKNGTIEEGVSLFQNGPSCMRVWFAGKYLVIISKYLARLVTNSNFEAMANSNSEKKRHYVVLKNQKQARLAWITTFLRRLSDYSNNLSLGRKTMNFIVQN